MEVLIYKKAFVGVKRKRNENKESFSKHMWEKVAESRMEKGNGKNLKHPTAEQCREKLQFISNRHL